MPRPGVRFSKILVDPARFQEFYNTKVAPDAAFLREACPLYELLPSEDPLAVVIADDPSAFAIIRGKDEFGKLGLIALTFVDGDVGHYRIRTH